MSAGAKTACWILATIVVAAMAQLGIDLADTTVGYRLMTAHVMTAIATSVAALLVRLPRDWDGDERRKR